MNILKYNLFGKEWSDYSENWNSLLIDEIDVADSILNLEIDQKMCDIARKQNDPMVKNTFCGDVRNFNFDPAGIPHADLILWSHGPEHINREEWQDTFARLEAMSTRGVILQMPAGIAYDCDEAHLSKNIQKGELEKFGYTVKYEGVWDTPSCSILAYKLKEMI
jgi:hypothetical protein